MKATSLLRADHKQVKALFAELKAAGVLPQQVELTPA